MKPGRPVATHRLRQERGALIADYARRKARHTGGRRSAGASLRTVTTELLRAELRNRRHEGAGEPSTGETFGLFSF